MHRRCCVVWRGSWIKADARGVAEWMLALSIAWAPWQVAKASAEKPAPQAAADAANPWSFNLTPYLWLTGVTGNYRAGPLSKSVDANFIDIAKKLDSFPLAFMGRFEAHYERFGLYLDGVYQNINFENQTGPRGIASVGLSTELGIMASCIGCLAHPRPITATGKGSPCPIVWTFMLVGARCG